MPMLELRLLGIPEVRLDGQPVTLTRRSAIGLLAYLAVDGASHPREFVTALFGGDGSDRQARRRVSNALADLRQQLPGCMLSSWRVVGLRPDVRCASDAKRFADLLGRARDATDADDLRKAAELYQGEFLAGMSLADAAEFDMWLLLRRESYHAQLVQALETLVKSAIRRSAWTEGAWAAQRLVALEPWHEEAHRQLMRCLGNCGQRHLALAQFEACRRLLRDEVGGEPSAETLALYRELRDGCVIAHNLPATTTPMIGRARESALLTTQLEASDTRLVSVVGPPGSGKTRLALEVAQAFVSGERGAPETPFQDGVFMLNARETTAPLLRPEIERVIGRRADRTSSPRLSTRAILLVVDGIEPTPATSGVIRELLEDMPGLTVLVTAAAPLRVDGEHVLTISGLDLPTSVNELETAASSALLLSEARRTDMRFVVSAGSRAALVRVCQLVGGLPQALIQAARALPQTSAASLARTLESAASGSGTELSAVVDAPAETSHNLEADGPAAAARRATPLVLVCTPDANAVGLVDRLRQEGMVVCVTHDMHGSLRVATSVGPDVVMIDPRLPRRLESLLRSHPTCSKASIHWLTEPAATTGPRPAAA